MANYIGIDLGTTFSAVATLDETGRAVIVHNQEGENLTPSVVSFLEGDHVDVGESARRTLGVDPNTIGRFKRDMGTSEPLPDSYTARGVEHTPTALSALVLKKLKDDAIKALQHIEEAVVTIPANFANEAREATMHAAKLAGLNVKYIINEPTAAALFYASKKGEELFGKYAVYDLGGGTFDISIINVSGQNVEVVATNGASKLGGDDFDEVMQKLVGKKFKEATGKEMDLQDYTKNDAEDDKKSLSKRDKCKKIISRQAIEITRNEFEEAISSLIAQTEMLCESSLDEADLSAGEIQAVFLAGGSTRMPCVRESVQKVFEKEPTSTANVDEVVALGAALYAAYKGDRSKLSAIQKHSVEKIKFSEITSKYYGVISLTGDEARERQKLANSILIKKGEKIPTATSETFFTVHEGQEGVDCRITECGAPETDPQFVNEIWSGLLELPGGRPANQKIEVTFSYDENQIMKCSFLDVESGNNTKVDLEMGAGSADGEDDIEKFIVE